MSMLYVVVNAAVRRLRPQILTSTFPSEPATIEAPIRVDMNATWQFTWEPAEAHSSVLWQILIAIPGLHYPQGWDSATVLVYHVNNGNLSYSIESTAKFQHVLIILTLQQVQLIITLQTQFSLPWFLEVQTPHWPHLLDRAIPSLITRAHVSGEFFVAHYYQPKKIGSLSDYYATEEFIVGSSGIATTMGMDVEPAFNGKKMWFDRKYWWPMMPHYYWPRYKI